MNTKYTGPIKEVEVVEKVKVKQEIATAIECVKSDTHWSIDSFLNSHARNENSGGGELWTHEFHPLNKLSVSELAKAFFVGYEIEPEQPKFKKGDFVFVNWHDGGRFHTVAGAYKKGITLYAEGEHNTAPPFDMVRHATPEEIYWLEELGRDKVGEFKDGDIYINQNNDCYLVGSDVFAERALDWYEEDYNFRGLYPADSFRLFKKEPSNGNH